MNALTTIWHDYRFEKPKDGSCKLAAFLVDDLGNIQPKICYIDTYHSKKARLKTSIWQHVRYWAYENEISQQIKTQLER